jgi:hypothetical protein
LLNLPATTALYLFDAQTGVQTDLHRQPVYAFSVATGAAATGRFFLNPGARHAYRHHARADGRSAQRVA